MRYLLPSLADTGVSSANLREHKRLPSQHPSEMRWFRDRTIIGDTARLPFEVHLLPLHRSFSHQVSR